MELIVHDNDMQHMVLATDILGCKVTFLFEYLLQSNYNVSLFAGIQVCCIGNNHYNWPLHVELI